MSGWSSLPSCPQKLLYAFVFLYLYFKQPANLFVSKDFKLTLIDYGNSRRIQSPDGQLVDAVGVTEFTGE